MQTCITCGKERDDEYFMRRTGQPYFVAPDGRAWPQEPLLPKVMEKTCHDCFVLEAIRGDTRYKEFK